MSIIINMHAKELLSMQLAWCKDFVLASYTEKRLMKSMDCEVVDQSDCAIKRKVNVESDKWSNEYDLGAPLVKISGGKYYLVELMNDMSS